MPLVKIITQILIPKTTSRKGIAFDMKYNFDTSIRKVKQELLYHIQTDAELNSYKNLDHIGKLYDPLAPGVIYTDTAKISDLLKLNRGNELANIFRLKSKFNNIEFINLENDPIDFLKPTPPLEQPIKINRP